MVSSCWRENGRSCSFFFFKVSLESPLLPCFLRAVAGLTAGLQGNAEWWQRSDVELLQWRHLWGKWLDKKSVELRPGRVLSMFLVIRPHWFYSFGRKKTHTHTLCWDQLRIDFFSEKRKPETQAWWFIPNTEIGKGIRRRELSLEICVSNLPHWSGMCNAPNTLVCAIICACLCLSASGFKQCFFSSAFCVFFRPISLICRKKLTRNIEKTHSGPT